MPPGTREVAESCLDLLNIELVHSYQRQLSNRPEIAGRRIESIGFQVGQQLAERYTKERQRFGDHLEVIKYICKDFWMDLFKKQIDNLKTNHRGVFVLQDSRFRWLTRVSTDKTHTGAGVGGAQSAGQLAMERMMASSGSAIKTASSAGLYLYLPCGLIRGALTNLGVPCVVTAEISSLPACSFTIKIKS
eukprot:TRINITY_DN4133_c0_g1_i1.p1 TRINITY_DN4133_c0_g1~~TRINITY_DN4133_c0_g1_i1.p1  ORF type:complete len:190 (-),score=34.95 TRINITY_DN4133_c0_g1_i1:210-779(-)